MYCLFLFSIDAFALEDEEEEEEVSDLPEQLREVALPSKGERGV